MGNLCRQILVLAAFVCLSLSAAYAADKVYRYINDKGVVVIDDNVPPQYARGGYEVLSISGQLLEVVPPQTDKSLAETEAEMQAAQVRKREDQFILANYKSIEEIEQARERKLLQLKRELQLVESNVADTRKQRNEERARAAKYQRAGKSVPSSVIQVLAELDDQERKAEILLTARNKELEGVNVLYDRYKSRFLELTSSSVVQGSVSPVLIASQK